MRLTTDADLIDARFSSMLGPEGGPMAIGPGDAYIIEPGHDAWVTGDEPAVGYEFESKTAETYARGS